MLWLYDSVLTRFLLANFDEAQVGFLHQLTTISTRVKKSIPDENYLTSERTRYEQSPLD